MKRLFVLLAALAAASAIVATSAFAAPQTSSGAVPSTAAKGLAADCTRGYYRNVSGRCVHRPIRRTTVPAGATARCRDRTYSFSQHASGTCSHHGGVAIWIHHP
jgi:hypothetical protein